MTDIPQNVPTSALENLDLANRDTVLTIGRMLLDSLDINLGEEGKINSVLWHPEDLSHDAALNAASKILDKCINAFVWEVIANNKTALTIFNELIADSDMRYNLRSSNVMILADNMRLEIIASLIKLVEKTKIAQQQGYQEEAKTQEVLLQEALATMMQYKIAFDSF